MPAIFQNGVWIPKSFRDFQKIAFLALITMCFTLTDSWQHPASPQLLCCAPSQSIAATKGGFIFDRPCTGSCSCVLQNVTCLCVCSPGHSFWWDLGAGGAGAWDGDSAHCECCRAWSGYPRDIPLLQHVSLVQGVWRVSKWKFFRVVLSC